MKSYRLTFQARQDYFDAFSFIVDTFSERTALKWEGKMLRALDQLTEWPQSGRIRPEFGPSHLHFWVEGDYIVLYDPETNPISIVSILHGAQDLFSLIAKRVEQYNSDEPEEKGN
jgi:plasmid stabilization system protein ParE